jgi:hypothetical protein
MTSRTNRHAEGRNQGGIDEVTPADLESRRQLAVKRYLDGDPIERICREMAVPKVGCPSGRIAIRLPHLPGLRNALGAPRPPRPKRLRPSKRPSSSSVGHCRQKAPNRRALAGCGIISAITPSRRSRRCARSIAFSSARDRRALSLQSRLATALPPWHRRTWSDSAATRTTPFRLSFSRGCSEGLRLSSR